MNLKKLKSISNSGTGYLLVILSKIISQKKGGTTTPLLSAECQIKKKSALSLRATRV